MITYIVYSHTSYLDVLEIQTEYLKDYKNKILLTNKGAQEPAFIKNYKNVMYYNESLPYASRLLKLKELDLDYILFTHDTDIVIDKDDETIEKILSTMVDNNIDRVDLQYRDFDPVGPLINPNTKRIDMGDFKLVKQEDTNAHIFNANPSIWKLSTYMDIIEKFKMESYRTIENYNSAGKNKIQKYCLQYDIYKLSSNNPLHCGYMRCIDKYQYFHITRGGQWFPLSGGRRLEGNDKFVKEYNKIVDKFNLRSGKRTFRNDGSRIGAPFPKINN